MASEDDPLLVNFILACQDDMWSVCNCYLASSHHFARLLGNKIVQDPNGLFIFWHSEKNVTVCLVLVTFPEASNKVNNLQIQHASWNPSEVMLS